MTVVSDIAWIDQGSEPAQVSAAKLHVLQLEPIKAKMILPKNRVIKPTVAVWLAAV